MQQFITRLARDAGTVLMRHYGKTHVQSRKERRDIVTDVDVESERVIVSAIRKKYPHHSILSEEVGMVGKNEEHRWIVDPLDGTVNYTSALPLFSVSIAYVHNNVPTIGVVFAPYLDEFFYAERGKGASLNGKRIQPSATTTLGDALIHVGLSAHYSPQHIRRNWAIMKRLSGVVRGLRMLESGALASCYVACGRLDGKVSIKTDPFGNAASTVIAEEAGGVVCDFDGHPWSPNMRTMICSTRSLSGTLRRLVR